MRMWRSTRKDSEGVRRQRQSARHVQTRMIQVHVGNHAGSSPVIRTKIQEVGRGRWFFDLFFYVHGNVLLG